MFRQSLLCTGATCFVLLRRWFFTGTARHSCKNVLPDGSNAEGEDIATPLNLRREDISDVVLYGYPYSPPCVKVRAFLAFYNVQFKTVNGRHPTSTYQKVPVLEINGRQINDSHIIVKNLVPVLVGKEWTEEELAWERKITFQFQPAIEIELCGCGDDLARLVGLDGWHRSLAGLAAPLVGTVVGWLFLSRYPECRLPSSQFGAEFRAALRGPFFHGEQPGPVDLSFFGTLAVFVSRGCRTSAEFLAASGLEEWHARMQAAVKIPFDT